MFENECYIHGAQTEIIGLGVLILLYAISSHSRIEYENLEKPQRRKLDLIAAIIILILYVGAYYFLKYMPSGSLEITV